MLSRLGNDTAVPTRIASTCGTNVLFCWSITAGTERGVVAASPGDVSETTTSLTGLPASSLIIASSVPAAET